MKTICNIVIIKKTLLIYFLLAVIVIPTMQSCNHHSATDRRLDAAESIMESRPDSALAILDSIEDSDLSGRKQKARHALLKSIALDKNYIDTTTFDVLQPAIDYYTKHGSPDEKLRTFYYQGRIHQNAGRDELSMQSWLNGSEIVGILDSLTLARLLISQGSLYYKQYKIIKFLENNLKAAIIFGSKNKYNMQLRSYIRALDGAIILKDRTRVDSIYKLCQLLDSVDVSNRNIPIYYARYTIEYDTPENIKYLLEKMKYDKMTDERSVIIARGYSKIGDIENALKYLDKVKISPGNELDSLSYLLIKSKIYERAGEYKKALEYFTSYSVKQETFQNVLLEEGLLLAEEKYKLEIKSLVSLKNKNIHLLLCICFILLLISAIVFIFYKNRLNKAALIIAQQEADRLRRNEEILKAEKINVTLELENLRLELNQLEDERNKLGNLLKERPEMTSEMMKVIYDRLDILNSLLAKEITSNDSYARPLIESIRKDRKGFLNSTLAALNATHPEFILYLKSRGLTEEEMNYVCLYSIGLRGKEIGEYLQLKRHYVLGSEIRKKLGIDEHETNLGPYLRKLMKISKESM